METILSIFVPIHREGHKFILLFGLITVMFILTGINFLIVSGIILTVWCVYFFRDPERVTPSREGLVISPADGVVQSIGEATPPAELDMGSEPCIRVCVFMNVFDVHVNRVPVSGKIIRQSYTEGKFLNAALEKASSDNERHAILMESTTGRNYAFVQIAGLVARRIVCWAEDDQEVSAGERFGLIRFGSRVDVYLPKGVNPLVCVGQRAVAGETVLADEKAREKSRIGEAR